MINSRNYSIPNDLTPNGSICDILKAPIKPVGSDVNVFLFSEGNWIASNAKRSVNTPNFYAHSVDYVRVIMCVSAAVTIYNHFWFVSGLLLVSQQILHSVDRQIKWRHDKRDIFGVGVDCCADMFSQIIVMSWWVSKDPTVLPAISLITAIDMTTGIFDYATTATCQYPVIKNRKGFFLGSQLLP